MAKTKGFQRGHRGAGPKRMPEPEPVKVGFAPDHRLHGLELTVKARVPVGVALAIRSGDVERALDPFMDQIIAWNLEEKDGKPVSVSRAAFDAEFDLEEAFDLINGWAEGVAAKMSTPLAEPSTDESISESG